MWEVKARSLLNLPFLLVGFLVLLVLLAPFDLVLLVSPFVLLSIQLVLFAFQLFVVTSYFYPTLCCDLLLFNSLLWLPMTTQLFVVTYPTLCFNLLLLFNSLLLPPSAQAEGFKIWWGAGTIVGLRRKFGRRVISLWVATENVFTKLQDTITLFLLPVKFTWSLQSEPNLGEELRRVQAQEGFSREKKVASIRY